MLEFFNSAQITNILAAMQKFNPWLSLGLFFIASFLMIWRLGALEKKGIEGTVLGTLIMPYCSGLSNLIFAYVMGRTGGSGTIVLENCLVNNVTNLSLLIGLPAIFWAMHIIPKQPKKRRRRDRNKASHLNRLSILLTTIALLFFTGVLWALAKDGGLDFGDGLALVGIFLFWQVFHVYEVLKTNVQEERHLSFFMLVDLILIIAGGYGVYISIEQLVAWIPKTGTGILVFANLGWLSGILMVLPNALLAFYFAKTGRPEIVYSSQIGDGHICIPLCVGIFALYTPIMIPSYFELSVFLILSAGLIHFLFLSIFGRLPRIMGVLLSMAYFFFIYKGLISP